MDEDSEALKIIGAKIKNKRQEKGFTQASFASFCGLDYRNLQRIEYGKANPSLKTLFIIATVLDIKYVDLFE